MEEGGTEWDEMKVVQLDKWINEWMAGWFGSTEFNRVLPSFSELYIVLSSFSELYIVLPSFT